MKLASSYLLHKYCICFCSRPNKRTNTIWNLSTIALWGSMINFTWIYLCSPSPLGTLTSSLLFKWSSLKWGTLLREPFSTEEILLKLRPNLKNKQTNKYVKLAHITIFLGLITSLRYCCRTNQTNFQNYVWGTDSPRRTNSVKHI